MAEAGAFYLTNEIVEIISKIPDNVLKGSSEPKLPSRRVSSTTKGSQQFIHVPFVKLSNPSDSNGDTAMDVKLAAEEPEIPTARFEESTPGSDDLLLPTQQFPTHFKEMPNL